MIIRLLLSPPQTLFLQDDKDAFYVADLGDILKKHLRWLKALPRVTPFYAVKCNDSRTIVKTLAAIGTGFDCASKVSKSGRAPESLYKMALVFPAGQIKVVFLGQQIVVRNLPCFSFLSSISRVYITHDLFFFRLKSNWCRVSGCLRRGSSMQILVNKCLRLSMLPITESR